MGGEQIYLFDINNRREIKKYSMSLIESSSERNESDELGNNEDNEEPSESPKNLYSSHKGKNRNFDKANYSYETEFYSQAINNYNLAMFSCSDSPSLYRNRAAALMKRRWYASSPSFDYLKLCFS